MVQTGQTYAELGEVEAAEACFAKGMEFASRLLHSQATAGKGSAQSQEWLQQVIELYMDRITTAWRLKQQVSL